MPDEAPGNSPPGYFSGPSLLRYLSGGHNLSRLRRLRFWFREDWAYCCDPKRKQQRGWLVLELLVSVPSSLLAALTDDWWRLSALPTSTRVGQLTLRIECALCRLEDRTAGKRKAAA